MYVRKNNTGDFAELNRASEKRVSAVGISNDGMFVCFADKFGVVYVVDIEDHNVEDGVTVIKKGVPILSHYCSIITRLVWSFIYFLKFSCFIFSHTRDSSVKYNLINYHGCSSCFYVL